MPQPIKQPDGPKDWMGPLIWSGVLLGATGTLGFLIKLLVHSVAYVLAIFGTLGTIILFYHSYIRSKKP